MCNLKKAPPQRKHKQKIEDRPSYSESIWPQYKPQEHSGVKTKERMHVNEIKKGNAFNTWRTTPKGLGTVLQLLVKFG